MKPSLPPFYSFPAFLTCALFIIGLTAWGPAYGQEKIRKPKQIEFAMLTVPGALHFGTGMNLPGRCSGYTNISFGMTNFNAARRMRLTLSAGKKYELVRGRYYLAGGFNAGVYYALLDGNPITHNYGLCVVPSLETGARMRRMIVAAGVYSMLGYGFYREFRDGSPYHDPSPEASGEFRTNYVAVPYIRLILEKKEVRRKAGNKTSAF
jgi:hypothetical protein